MADCLKTMALIFSKLRPTQFSHKRYFRLPGKAEPSVSIKVSQSLYMQGFRRYKTHLKITELTKKTKEETTEIMMILASKLTLTISLEKTLEDNILHYM